MASNVWYRAVISSDQVASGHVRVIQQRFAEAMRSAGNPEGACLFVTSHDAREGRLQEDADDEVPADADEVYFSPASVSIVPDLIGAYAGEPCPPPERARAALLVGMEADWNLLQRTTH
jgi:hypothetical protein